ncbi:hypothetical protein DACRYDRAFT_109074 [Dacryopinax primogenitus]|uniref:CxC2-like cysteine cluster KDZ transposase-associated domain-containing protein n=1 Tax=Dacryopinax primogenitus (strain DJM 731) TaxID=1858805 RepID=M5FSE4_DACPD|nr:uncharacterized protein DACRYDRAFT_109074 [Dacryopinax primogenitus]EJU00336.1 hypothetical protein DACRYDRAFT_109074 [Dacryopinax primogenitus]
MSPRKRKNPNIFVIDGPSPPQKRNVRRSGQRPDVPIGTFLDLELERPAPPLIDAKTQKEPVKAGETEAYSDFISKFEVKRSIIIEEVVRDCFQALPLCGTCQVTAHVHNPFHWTEVWERKFYRRKSLRDLGLVICLGHNGAACPASTPPALTPFVVIYANGIHNVLMSFCQCYGCPNRYVQLLRAKLFPATFDNPKTAFSFAVMKDFHMHTLCSKKSAYDYYAKLVRQTSDIVPASTNDRYRELLRASRIWMDLEASRRCGEAHGITNNLPPFAATRVRSPLCPACPQLGINITEEELAKADPAKPHLVALYLGGDGNFTLSAKKKNVDANDVGLLRGRGFFPDQTHFTNYIRTHEDMKLCHHRFSLSFKLGAAGVDGEGVERTWAEHNQLGGSTKEMNPGHRLDCLEAHFTDWNWKKQRDMIPFLCRRMISARKHLQHCQEYFDNLSVAFGPRVDRWKVQPEYLERTDGSFCSVYRFPDEAVPSQRHAADRLRDEEETALESIAAAIGRAERGDSVSFIQLGIALEECLQFNRHWMN